MMVLQFSFSLLLEDVDKLNRRRCSIDCEDISCVYHDLKKEKKKMYFGYPETKLI